VYKILAKLPFSSNNLHYLPSCHSTNESAQQLLQSDAKEGTVVITDDQTSGKGLAGNEWQTNPGQNLTFSLVLNPSFLLPKEQFFLTIAVSLGLKDALDDLLPGDIKIKWPNDIYYNNKKMAGLLIENSIRGNSLESCVVGIGLNVNQVEFPQKYNATSVSLETGIQYDLNEQLNIILSNIGFYYLKLKSEERELLQERYHTSLLGINENLLFKDEQGKFKGEILGTDEYGRLIIKKNGRQQSYQRKEVEMLF
jgi:BirA family biotin operon repressor/biotin-[acetyl-CoA-carboxylase] ligase